MSKPSNMLPNYPVIISHLATRAPCRQQYFTVCSGEPMPEISEMYDKMPRYLCPLCSQSWDWANSKQKKDNDG